MNIYDLGEEKLAWSSLSPRTDLALTNHTERRICFTTFWGQFITDIKNGDAKPIDISYYGVATFNKVKTFTIKPVHYLSTNPENNASKGWVLGALNFNASLTNFRRILTSKIVDVSDAKAADVIYNRTHAVSNPGQTAIMKAVANWMWQPRPGAAARSAGDPPFSHHFHMRAGAREVEDAGWRFVDAQA